MILASLSILLASGMLNRVRGTTWDWLPGRNLYFVAPLLGAIAGYHTHSWQIGLAFCLTYLVWASGPWGRWFDLGRLSPDYNRPGIPLNLYERAIQAVAGTSDHRCLALRHMVGAFPGFTALALLEGVPLAAGLAIPFGLVVMAFYETAWRVRPSEPIIVAEVLTGLLWGAIILSL
jgi:hypothetical protein